MCKTLIITLFCYNTDSTVDPKTSVIMRLQCSYFFAAKIGSCGIYGCFESFEIKFEYYRKMDNSMTDIVYFYAAIYNASM